MTNKDTDFSVGFGFGPIGGINFDVNYSQKETKNEPAQQPAITALPAPSGSEARGVESDEREYVLRASRSEARGFEYEEREYGGRPRESEARGPEAIRNEGQSQIIDFYKNQSPANDYKIETILNSWDYRKLEDVPDTIQWIFPTSHPGQNRRIPVLTPEVAKIISNTPELRGRVRRAFEMMLKFYGMRLTQDTKFEIADTFKLGKLNQWSNHNFLRITRILESLKELGLKELMVPWLMFLKDLIYKENLLDCASTSFQGHWYQTLDEEDKQDLEAAIE